MIGACTRWRQGQDFVCGCVQTELSPPPPISPAAGAAALPRRGRSGQDSVGVLDAQHVVCTEGPPHVGPAQVFVLVLAES